MEFRASASIALPKYVATVARYWACCCLCLCSVFAQSPSSTDVKPDYSREAFVCEEDVTHLAFENDGTSVRELTSRIRIQSGAGVQHFGVLTFPYESSTGTVDIDYVQVRKPDGTTVLTPADASSLLQ